MLLTGKKNSRIFKLSRLVASGLLLLCLSTSLLAAEFSIPSQAPMVLGKWQKVTIESGSSLANIALKYGVSIHTILLHNPGLSSKKYLRRGQTLMVPTCFWLPQQVGNGEIVINIATQTLFYRPLDQNVLWAFPVTVGKSDEPTPQGVFFIKKKARNPTWYPAAAVRAGYAKKGISLPFSVEGGKDNPLGAYAMYLNKPTYLIHTASSINALGGRQSYGCVRMYEQDIAQLYAMVPIKTSVRIIDVPNPDEDKMYNYCSKDI